MFSKMIKGFGMIGISCIAALLFTGLVSLCVKFHTLAFICGGLFVLLLAYVMGDFIS